MSTPMTKPFQLPRLLTVDEMAERLNVCSKTIRRWIAGNELPAHRLGRSVRVAEDDLMAFLGKHRR